MSKHSPGPWVWNHARTRLNDPTGRPVLMDGEGIWDLCAPALHKDGRAHANAKLISAAPDLLAALKAYQAAGFGNSTDFVLQGVAYDKAVEALAKAGG